MSGTSDTNSAGKLQTELTSMYHLTGCSGLTNLGVCRLTLPRLPALPNQRLQLQQRINVRALLRMVALPQPNLSGDCGKMNPDRSPNGATQLIWCLCFNFQARECFVGIMLHPYDTAMQSIIV